jgi:transposase
MKRRRHIIVDTLGLLLNVIDLPADLQDRQLVRNLLDQTRPRFLFVKCIDADRDYVGVKTAAMILSTGCWKIKIVKCSDARRFVDLPRRWIGERTFIWISRNRVLMREFEHYAISTVALWRFAMIRLQLGACRATSGVAPRNAMRDCVSNRVHTECEARLDDLRTPR